MGLYIKWHTSRTLFSGHAMLLLAGFSSELDPLLHAEALFILVGN